MGSNLGSAGAGRGPDLVVWVQLPRELPQRMTSTPRMCHHMPDDSSQPGLESRDLWGHKRPSVEERQVPWVLFVWHVAAASAVIEPCQ